MNWKQVVVVLGLLVFSNSIAQASWEDKMRGYTIFPTSPDSYSDDDFHQTVDNLKSMGADTVSLIVPWYQENVNSNTQHRGWNTASDEALKDGMQYINNKGLKVSLLVHADVDDGTWRAKINPSDRDQWFDSMGNIIKKYAKDFAALYDATLFSVGTEMHHTVSNEYNSDNASRPGKYRWEDIINDVKAEYTGTVTYSAQHSGGMSAVLENNDLISKLDAVGFSAYWAMDDPQTKEDIKKGWEKIERENIKPVREKYNKDILFMEGGYRPCSWALNRPWDNWSGCSYDGEAQARAYEGLLEFLKDKAYFKGAPSLWAFENDPHAGGTGNIQYTPWGKPAEEVIRNYWKFGLSDSGDNDPGDSDDNSSSGEEECIATVHTSTNGGWGYSSTTGYGCVVNGTEDQGDEAQDEEEEDDNEGNENEECYDWDGDGWGWNGENGCRIYDEEIEEEEGDRCVATIHTSFNGGWGYNFKTVKGCQVGGSNPSGQEDQEQETVEVVNTEVKLDEEKDEGVKEESKDDDKNKSEEEPAKEGGEVDNTDEVIKEEINEGDGDKAEDVENQDSPEDKCIATNDTDANGGWGYNKATGKGCEL
jgi:hypothetical protein